MGAMVLFDGVCNFCDASVNFIIERDPKGYFKFAPLQSEVGSKLAADHGLASEPADRRTKGDLIPIDSVILIEEGRAYTHSTAALRILRRIGGIWSLLYVL